MAFSAKFWGTRGSIPTPGPETFKYGGNTPCVEIKCGGALMICDAGTGMREMGVDLMRRGKSPIVGHMFFSHMHWDHIQGFPFFLPVYLPENTFFVYGTSPGDRRFFDLLSGQMRSDYFPVNFSDLKAKLIPSDLGTGERAIEGVDVRCFEQVHNGRSFGYSFEYGGKKVVYATDNELDLTIGNAEEAKRDAAALRLIPKAFVEFVSGADLLIADGQYTDEEYPGKTGWGHPRATTLVDLAVQAEVRQLAVFHHDPMQSDDDVKSKVDRCRERAAAFNREMVIFAAREGIELKID